MIKTLSDVTSDVMKDSPGDAAPYGSYLVGRLVAYADLPTATVSHLFVFVDVEKGPAHVRMWKAGLESGCKEIDGGDDAKKSSKVPRPSDERDLVEKTGMGWVEQVRSGASRGSSLIIYLILYPWLWPQCSRVSVSRFMSWARG